jgi:hypothetical protein
MENYLDLLKIRQKGRRRDAVILGGIFWLVFIALVFLLITGQLTGRTKIIVAAMEVVFGAAYLMAWVRLEVTRNTIDLIRSTME